MPGVQGTYIQYEGAGDQYVGRTASGLPSNDSRFGVVGPFFMEQEVGMDDPHWINLDRMVKSIFPNLPITCHLTGRWLLASLVYHRTFLQETLPLEHPLLRTPVMASEVVYDNLKDLVAIKNVRIQFI
jgi:hypothetical protein